MSDYDGLWLPESVIDAKATDSGFSVHRSFSNRITGAGGGDDLISNTTLRTAKYLSRDVLETLYVESWSAGKVIDLIVDDIFAPGVVWNEEGENRDRMIEHLDDMDFWSNLADAARAGRLFGTALLIACPSRRSMFSKPLDIDSIQEGDIANLAVVDRHSLVVKEVYNDPTQPKFGKPYSYEWNYRSANDIMGIDREPPGSPFNLLVHESRCFRFDGIKALNREGWMDIAAERWWGYSILHRVLDELIQDMLMSASGADVVQRTGMPVILMNRFRESLSQGVNGPHGGFQQYADKIAQGMSFRKLMILDAKDQVSQIQINSSGVRDLLDSQVERLAMIAGVPITRFTGASAMGLNATGNGDAREWRTTVEAYRKKNIEPHMKTLMALMAKNAGLSSTPEWEWGRLGELTLQEQVEAMKGASEAVSKMYLARFIDEAEARVIMSTLPSVNLDPESWTPPELYEEEKQLEKERLDKQEKMKYNERQNENDR